MALFSLSIFRVYIIPYLLQSLFAIASVTIILEVLRKTRVIVAVFAFLSKVATIRQRFYRPDYRKHLPSQLPKQILRHEYLLLRMMSWSNKISSTHKGILLQQLINVFCIIIFYLRNRWTDSSCPCSDASTSPPWSSTMRFTMASPSPELWGVLLAWSAQ